MQLRTDWRDIIEVELENFRIRMTKIIDEMFVKKDDVIVVKQEPEIEETGNGCEFKGNEFNPVLKEDEAVADEAPIDTKTKGWSKQETETKTVTRKDQVQELVEEVGGLQIWLGDDNSDLVERQPVVDQIHHQKVSSKTSTVIDDYEKLDGIYSMMFVDKNVVVDDPYGFRLLVMGSYDV